MARATHALGTPQVRTPRGPRGRGGLEKLAEMSAGNSAKGGGEARKKDPGREEDGVDQLAGLEGRLSWRDPGTLIYKRTLPLVEEKVNQRTVCERLRRLHKSHMDTVPSLSRNIDTITESHKNRNT